MNDGMDTLTGIAKKLVELHDERKEHEDIAAQLQKEYNALSEDFLRYVKNHDVDSITVDGRCVHYTTETRPKIMDQEKCFAFFREHDCGSIIKETIHSGTLGKTLKELVAAGVADLTNLEDTGLSVYVQEVVRVPKK